MNNSILYEHLSREEINELGNNWKDIEKNCPDIALLAKSRVDGGFLRSLDFYEGVGTGMINSSNLSRRLYNGFPNGDTLEEYMHKVMFAYVAFQLNNT